MFSIGSFSILLIEMFFEQFENYKNGWFIDYHLSHLFNNGVFNSILFSLFQIVLGFIFLFVFFSVTQALFKFIGWFFGESEIISVEADSDNSNK